MKILVPVLITIILAAQGRTQESYSVREIKLPDWQEDTEIHDIQQDELGLLWLATDRGLYRYDGTEMVSYFHHPFELSSLRSDKVNCLFVNHNSRLLLGTHKGLHRYLKSSNTFKQYNFTSSLDIQIIIEDLHDYLWFWSRDGLHWLYHEPGTDEYWGEAELPELLSRVDLEIHDAMITPEDEMWIATNAGLVVLSLADRCTPVLVFHDDRFSSNGQFGQLRTIKRDIKGRIWLGSEHVTYVISKERDLVEVLNEDENQSLSSTSIILSPSGKLYLADESQVFVLSTRHESEMIRSLDLNYGFQWPDDDITLLKEDLLKPENIFILTQDDKLYYLERAEVRTTPAKFLSPEVYSDMRFIKNKVLLLEDEGSWLIYHQENEVASPLRVQAVDHVKPDEIIDICLSEKAIKLALQGRILEIALENGEITREFSLSSFDITALECQEDTLWLGTSGQGLVKMRNVNEHLNSYVHEVNDPSGLPSNEINDLQFDKGGSLWIATDEGVTLLDISLDRFRTFRRSAGLPDNHIKALTIDSQTGVWVLTAKGPAIYQQEEDRFHVLKGVYSESVNATDLSHIDQSLLLITDSLAVNVFLDRIEFQRDLIPIRFSKLYDASGKEHYLLHRNPDADISVPYEHNSLLIEFVTIQPSARLHYTFEYELSGKDAESGALNDAKSLNLNSLSAGDYQLTIKAIDDRGQLCGQDMIRFGVLPPFWMTSSFFLLIVALLLMLFFIYWLIIKDQERKRVAAIRDIRKRTAADFHDELGSRLTVISLYGNMIREKKGTNPESEAYLEKVLDSANELYYAMKDVIWSLKPEAENLNGLLDHIEDLARRLFKSTRTDLEVTRSGRPPEELPVSKLTSKNVSLICREVMNNVIKHAEATSFILDISLEQNLLTIRMQDNGKGIPEDHGYGEGMENMKLRSEEINGELSVKSSKKGTSVTLLFKI
ncbi:MAG: two-component regulator propeller domain-containing protein [Saprospiraceae bacterium]|nr:two-component regulator propeller domain-containing protein [Saprospiraceae bacterium]